MRHVFVLSRDHPWTPWLYDYLLERFHGDEHVEVVIDRRFSERRVVAPGVQAGRGRERRTTERRRPLGPADDLRAQSHYIVEL